MRDQELEMMPDGGPYQNGAGSLASSGSKARVGPSPASFTVCPWVGYVPSLSLAYCICELGLNGCLWGTVWIVSCGQGIGLLHPLAWVARRDSALSNRPKPDLPHLAESSPCWRCPWGSERVPDHHWWQYGGSVGWDIRVMTREDRTGLKFWSWHFMPGDLGQVNQLSWALILSLAMPHSDVGGVH